VKKTAGREGDRASGWGWGDTNSQRMLVLGFGGCGGTGALVVEDDTRQHELARVV
jgi:hypothetical protein